MDKLQSDSKSKREGWKTELPSTGLGTTVLEKMREEKINDAVWQGKCSGTVYVSNYGKIFNSDKICTWDGPAPHPFVCTT